MRGWLKIMTSHLYCTGIGAGYSIWYGYGDIKILKNKYTAIYNIFYIKL
jgi:hypothetical protein